MRGDFRQPGLKIKVLAPVKESGSVTIQANVVMFRNTGNRSWEIDGGVLLAPGDHIVFGGHNDNRMMSQDFQLELKSPVLLAANGYEPNPRLEVIEGYNIDSEFSDYTERT